MPAHNSWTSMMSGKPDLTIKSSVIEHQIQSVFARDSVGTQFHGRPKSTYSIRRFFRKSHKQLRAVQIESLKNQLIECCLTHIQDSYRVHLNRLKGLKILETFIHLVHISKISSELATHMVWACLSCIHHFLLRLKSEGGLMQWLRRKQARKSIRVFDNLMTFLIPFYYPVVFSAVITFFEEANIWDIEYFCSNLLERLFLVVDEKRKTDSMMEIISSWYGSRHTQVTLCFLLLAIAYAMRVNLSVAIVAMTDKNTTSNPDIPTYNWDDKSVVLSSFFWGYVVLQVFAGQFGKMYGPRWFLVVAMTVNSIVCMLTPIVADNLGSKGVMGCRVVQGLFQGFIFPSVHNILGKWAPTPERSRMGTFVYSGSSFGTIIAMPITGLISASWLGWPVSFYVFGCFGLLWVGLWLGLGANSPAEHRGISEEERFYIEATLGQQEHKVVPTPWKAIFTSWPMWAIIVANFGQNWGYSTLLTEIPNYMNKIMHFDMQSNSLLSAAPYLALWVLSFVFGPISDHLINRKILSRGSVRKIFNAIGTCGPALALVALGFVPEDQTDLSVALLIVVVGINAAVFCGFQVNHIDLAPNHAGTLMGITNGSSNIFSIIAPLVVQVVVYDETDKALWRIVFVIAAAWYVASAIFYIFFASGEIQEWNDDVKDERMKSEEEGKG